MPNVMDASVVKKVFVAWNLRYGTYVHLVPDERPLIVAQAPADRTSEWLMTTGLILWDNKTGSLVK